jgi:hypothetical protein
MSMTTGDSLENLPRFTPNTLLEEDSREALLKVFPKTRFKIRDEHTDVGIDVYIELRSDNKTYTNERFVVQLKSRENSKHNNDGSFSKPIDTSNINYLLRSDHRAMYIFYVSETQKFYYEWVDLFRDQLNRTNLNWKRQQTNVLRFHKLLDEAAVEEVYNDIKRRSRLLRQRRDGVSAESVIDSFHESIDQKAYLDIIGSLTKLIDNFEGLSVLPGHILSKLPPFSKSTKSQSHFNDIDYTLYTDNRALFDFFKDVRLDVDNYFKISDGSVLPQESMRQIFSFLEYNFIYHIAPSRDNNGDERVCVHNLFQHKGCDCERCSLKKLRWSMAIAKAKAPLDESNFNNWFRRGFVLLELGKIAEALGLYKKLGEESLLKKRYVAYIVSKFHMVSCSFLIRNAFHVDNSDTLLDEVSKIDLQLEIDNIAERPEVKSEVVKVLKWLVSSSYYLATFVEMDLRFRDAIKSWDIDRRGSVVSINHYQKVSATSSELTVFVEGNTFHPSYFNGLRLFVLKVIEAGLIQYSLKNPMSNRISDVHPYFLHLCFTYCEAENINELFIKYKVDRLSFGEYEGEPDGKLLVYVNDLISSLDGCADFIRSEYEAGNASPKRKLNSHLKVAMVLVSIADLTDIQVNDLVLKFVSITNHDIIEAATIGQLKNILNRRKHVLKSSTFMACYFVLLESKEFDRILLTKELPFYLKEAHPDFVDNELKTNYVVRKRIQELTNFNDYKVYILLFYFQVAPEEIKKEITNRVETLLENHFDTQVFFLAAFHGISACDRFFVKLIERVPRLEMAKKSTISMLGYEDFRNDNLDRLISLAYKYGIDLMRPEIQALADGVDYYEWLLNLDGFDYEKFDAYWLLYEPNLIFLNEFKKYKKLKDAVKKYITQSRVSRLQEIYMEHLCDCPE